MGRSKHSGEGWMDDPIGKAKEKVKEYFSSEREEKKGSAATAGKQTVSAKERKRKMIEEETGIKGKR